GKDNKHQISLGFQGGYVQKQLKTNDMLFGDQIANGTITGIPTSEFFNNNNRSFADFNAGLFYNAILSEKFTLFAGYSFFHLSTPDESFRGNISSNLGYRQVAHGGVQWDITDK